MKCNMLKQEPIKRKISKKGFYNTPTLLERELLILREKSLQSLLLPSPIVIPIERRFVHKHNPHTHLECCECFWSLGSIGRCQGWWMQYGVYCGIQKAREDTISLNLVGARSLEGLGASDRLGLEGLLLFMYPNFIFQWIILPLGGRQRGFSESFSVSFSITRADVILVFASLFPYSLTINCCYVCA